MHPHNCPYWWVFLLLLTIIIITSCKIFKPVLVDGLSLESEWLQVSSSLQEFSQYYGQYQQYWHLDSLGFSFDIQLSGLLTKPVGTFVSSPIAIGITVTFLFHSSFSSLGIFLILDQLISLFFFFYFYSVVSWSAESLLRQALSFFYSFAGYY